MSELENIIYGGGSFGNGIFTVTRDHILHRTHIVLDYLDFDHQTPRITGTTNVRFPVAAVSFQTVFC